MSCSQFFSADSKLAQAIDGYSPRTSQIQMANKIADAIDSEQNLIAEAGTGTGKTFAYLVPAILAGKKTIISTGTKNLQDQLFNKDLPLIRQTIATPCSVALLKGRANYLCLYRLEDALHTNFGYNKKDAVAIAAIDKWAKRTKTGDISEVAQCQEGDPVWQQATSTTDNCLGQECPVYTDCFLTKARKKAFAADIVVVNHHLLCADWSLKDTGFGELLPPGEVVIIDEAHQFGDIASNFLGVTVTGRRLNGLAADTLAEYFKDAKDMPDIRTFAEDLQFEVKNFRLALGVQPQRGEWQDLSSNPKITAAMDAVHSCLEKLADHLEAASVRSKGLESCFDRAQLLEEDLADLINTTDQQWIRWYETFTHSFSLSKTPLDIATEFQKFMGQRQASWIFTSATLSVADNFAYFAQSLGLADTESHSWHSPFDFQQQALFYHPKDLPNPSDADYTELVIEAAIPVLQASKGRAFFLFTSYRALNVAEEILQERLDFPLLVQGRQAKTVLLHEFKQQGNAVLLATSSFWEGVDVRGEALSCVIIDKFPFASPGDPILKARLQALKNNGVNAFSEQQLPAAVIALRQGAGRLIRDISDRGVLMICDPRLLKKGYGKTFLNSLPDMARTRDIADVEKFFQQAD